MKIFLRTILIAGIIIIINPALVIGMIDEEEAKNKENYKIKAYWDKVEENIERVRKRNEECKYCWNISHWACGIKEYLERCLCCGIEIDENRATIIKNRREEIVETTDCLSVALSTQMGHSGFCDNPITGIFCCPLATGLQIIALPCYAFIDCLGLCCGGSENQQIYYDDQYKAYYSPPVYIPPSPSTIAKQKAEYERKQRILSDIRKGKYSPETERRKYWEATH